MHIVQSNIPKSQGITFYPTKVSQVTHKMSQGVGPRGRGLLATVWNNFRKSFSPSAEEGPMVGRDPFGNTFYEVPADPRWVRGYQRV